MADFALEAFREYIEKAYRKFYDEFSIRADAIGCARASSLHSECFVADARAYPDGNEAVHVNGVLRIDQLPRARTNKPRAAQAQGISVLMLSYEDYRFDGRPAAKANCILQSSSVHLGYYQRRQNNKFATLEALRYDFSKHGARDAHPVFHAQFEQGKLDTDPRVLGLIPGLTIEPILETRMTSVRIPTSNMTGPMALLTIAADHLGQADFNDLLTAYRNTAFFKNWKCRFAFMDSAFPTPIHCASTWYSSQVCM